MINLKQLSDSGPFSLTGMQVMSAHLLLLFKKCDFRREVPQVWASDTKELGTNHKLFVPRHWNFPLKSVADFLIL